MHGSQSQQPKIVSFCLCFIYIVFNMFDIIVVDSATDVKPIININNLWKKYVVIFFHNLSIAHYDSQSVSKVNKKNGISRLYVTLTVNQIYVKC